MGSDSDLAASETYDDEQNLDACEAMENFHGDFDFIDSSSMTASEAVNLHQLLWNVTRPDSEVRRQVNVLNGSLVNAFNSSYPAALAEGVPVWEYVLRRLAASFHSALMTISN